VEAVVESVGRQPVSSFKSRHQGHDLTFYSFHAGDLQGMEAFEKSGTIQPDPAGRVKTWRMRLGLKRIPRSQKSGCNAHRICSMTPQDSCTAHRLHAVVCLSITTSPADFRRALASRTWDEDVVFVQSPSQRCLVSYEIFKGKPSPTATLQRTTLLRIG
jgi:hypothetical protein